MSRFKAELMGKTATTSKPAFLTIPRWEGVPWLIHGFGTAAWRERDFRDVDQGTKFRLVILNQVHSDTVYRLEDSPRRKLKGDGLITHRPGLLLIIKTADCLPLLALDEGRRVIAAAHCGWRGTQKRIVEKLVRDLQNHYGCDPASLLVALGPCIGPECYEVGEDVEKAFKENGFPPALFEKRSNRPGKYLLDLRAANLWLLRRAGLKENNIFSIETCTRCSAELLSYRRDRDKKRRMYAFIGKYR